MSLSASACHLQITPAEPVGCYLAGFGADRRATGVLDPIEAGLLYVTDGHEEVALISVDAIGFSSTDVSRVRAHVPEMGPHDIIISATHTHSAPDTLGLWGPTWLGLIPRHSGVDLLWWHETLDRIGLALSALRETAEPATLRSTHFNVEPNWTRNDRLGGGRFDHAMAFQLLKPASLEPLCTLLNYASHPEALWSDNTLISADFPGHFRRHIRAEVGGEALYINGPLGGMLTPNVAKEADLEERRTYITALGKHLAEQTIRALDQSHLEQEPTLSHNWIPLTLPNQNWKLRTLRRLGILNTKTKDSCVATEVHHVALGSVEVLTAPGELTPEVGQEVMAMMTGRDLGVFGLTIDEVGYILRHDQFHHPEYRYERSVSLGPRTAERLLAAHATLVE